MAIPKGLDPTGVILVDKPAGPSSFAVLAGVRARTRAKTGHAGTLDPFATGSCCCCPVGQRQTGIMLRRTAQALSHRHRPVVPDDAPATPRATRSTCHAPPGRAALDAALAALRGESSYRSPRPRR